MSEGRIQPKPRPGSATGDIGSQSRCRRTGYFCCACLHAADGHGRGRLSQAQGGCATDCRPNACLPPGRPFPGCSSLSRARQASSEATHCRVIRPHVHVSCGSTLPVLHVASARKVYLDELTNRRRGGTEQRCQKQKNLNNRLPDPGHGSFLHDKRRWCRRDARRGYYSLIEPHVDKIEAREMARVQLPASDALVMHHGPVPP